MMADIIDARGLRCPWPVLRLAKALREGAGGVTIVADDPIAPDEIASFARERGLGCTEAQTPIGTGFFVG
jgi:tRNA 2-thiouridine synthesizing protein A